jgi:hypothetical protein
MGSRNPTPKKAAPFCLRYRSLEDRAASPFADQLLKVRYFTNRGYIRRKGVYTQDL